MPKNLGIREGMMMLRRFIHKALAFRLPRAEAVLAETPVRIRTHRTGEAFPFNDRQIKEIAVREQESRDTGLLKALSVALCFFAVFLGGCTGRLSYRESTALAERGAIENAPFTWNVHQGMLGVRFGMTKKEVLGVLGAPCEKITPRAWQYHRLGLAVVFDKQGRVQSFLAGSNGCDPSQRLTKAFKGVTEKGIKMGSKEEEVLRAYGSPSFRKTYSYETQILTYNKPGERFAFTLRNGRVAHLYAVVITKP